MATAEATREFSKETKDLGDKIVGLTLKAAKELSDYLDEVHGIKPAAGGAVVMAAPAGGAAGGAGGGEAAAEKTERFAGRASCVPARNRYSFCLSRLVASSLPPRSSFRRRCRAALFPGSFPGGVGRGVS